MSSLGATIKKRREELQEVTQANAVEMDSIKSQAADAIAKAKDDHEKKVPYRNVNHARLGDRRLLVSQRRRCTPPYGSLLCMCFTINVPHAPKGGAMLRQSLDISSQK